MVSAMSMAEERLEAVKSRLDELSMLLKELEKRRDEILDEMSRLSAVGGCLEYKPVRNKVGKVYYYWYLRVYDGGKLRSIYLGKHIPEHIVRGMAEREKLRELKKELEQVAERITKIYRALARIELILSTI